MLASSTKTLSAAPTGRRELAQRIRETIVQGLRQPPSETAFNRLALDVFTYQFTHVAPFGRLCRSRGIGDPRQVDHWRLIPCVPTEAFKYYRLAGRRRRSEEVVFETSGTTRGRPGRHYLFDTRLYETAALPWFERHVVAGGRFRFLALTASPEERPTSSLIHMIEATGRRFGVGGGVAYFYRPEGPDAASLKAAIEESVAEGQPVLILTTAFALLELLDRLAAAGGRLRLPPNSRLMETGGYKGRLRRLSPEALYGETEKALGLPPSSIVNEYGMTEMSSQFYDRMISEPGLDPAHARLKCPPPWVATTVVNPIRLEEVPDGEIGLLRHVDLANLDSCAFLQTTDLARRRGPDFELLGRPEEAELRGCSLGYESR